MAEKKRVLECDFSHFQIHSLDHLPAKYRRLLLGEQEDGDCEDPSPDYKYIPGFIPRSKLSVYAFPLLAVLIGLIIFIANGGNNFVFLVIYMVAAFQITDKYRPTIYQPVPGDWKGGYYLVGDEAILKFHPARNMLWLIPIRNIVNVEHFEPYEVEFEPEEFLGKNVHNTILTCQSRCKGETFDFPIFDLADREKGKEIVKWFKRYTDGDSNEVDPLIAKFARVCDENTTLLCA